MSFHIVHRSRRCLAVTLLKGRWLNMSRYRCNHQSCRPAEPRVSSLALKLEDVIAFYQTNRNVTKREAQKNNRLWGSRTSSVSSWASLWWALRSIQPEHDGILDLVLIQQVMWPGRYWTKILIIHEIYLRCWNPKKFNKKAMCLIQPGQEDILDLVLIHWVTWGY